jgi:ElaA protein
MQIRTKNFSELTTLEYHRLMEIRVAVFVVEQECAYQEIDAIDLEATHLWFADEADNVLAYARIYKEDNTIHFGRVLVAKEWRGQRLGQKLIAEVISFIEKRYPSQPIKISAQAHLQAFYGTFGFQVVSKEYLEDGIPHVDMQKNTV